MPDGTDQLPGLMDIAAPNELAMQRLLAQKLISAGTSPIEPVSGAGAVSPFQAIGGLLQERAGLNRLNQAAQQERQQRAAFGAAETGTGPAGAGPLSAQPPDAQATGYSDNLTPLMNAVSREEGTGSYSQLGPLTKDGDRAYGKYQVMGKNIGPWSQEILGHQLSPEQFLRNPGAQEAIARTKLGQYAQQYGPEGAAKAWFAGPAGMSNPNARDQLGTTVGQYGANVMAMMPGATAPQAQPQNASAVGPLAYRPPGGVPVPDTGVPSAGTPAPGMFAQRPGMTAQQLAVIQSSPLASDADKAEARARYLEQFQPLSLQAYGGNYILNPRTGQQFFVPGVQMTTKKVGSIEKPVPMTMFPPGYNMAPPQVQQLPVQQGASGPQSMNAPPVAPAVGAPSITAAATGAGKSILDSVPADLSADDKKAMETGTPGKQSQAETPARLAMAEEVASDAPLPGVRAGNPAQGGPLAAKPPMPASMQTAQAGAGPAADVTSEDASDLNYLQDLAVQQKSREEGATQAADSARKFYDGVSEQSMAAVQQRDMLSEMANVVDAPNFYSGFGSPFVLAAKRLLAATGIDPNSAAAMEAFNKMRNDLNLSSLRSKLGGLGQIRLAEVNMVNNAFANLDNSVAANKALIYMAQQINNRTIGAGELANQYVMAHGGIADQSLRNRLFNYYKDKPLLTDEQIKQFNSMITAESHSKSTAGGPLAAPPPSAGAPPPPPPGNWK